MGIFAKVGHGLMLNVKGTPYDQGKQQGQVAAELIRNNVNHIKRSLLNMKVDQAQYDDLLQKNLHFYEKTEPEIVEEMKGIADGSGISFHDIVTINLPLFFVLKWLPQECSSILARGSPQAGQLVLPMVWSKLGGYHAENERTLIVSYLDDFKMKAYSSMLRARESVFSAIRPGVTFETLYGAAISVFEADGFGSILPGRIGHGIGLSAHEFPSIKKGNQIQLQPGMVFTVEPGLMSIEWGGVRHSDTVLVTETGCEVLTRTDRGVLKI